MNCKKCGNRMNEGARFCISCGAEHDSNGQLIIKNSKFDYNKTVMINNSSNSNSKIDYNKTVMSNEIKCNNKVDYNKTMMASDIKSQMKVDYNKTMMASDLQNSNNANFKSNSVNNKNILKQSDKKLPNIIFLCIGILALIILGMIITFNNNHKKKEPEIIKETNTSQNKVSDFDSTDGYWSKDAEFFYRDGTIQKNQWIGDFYVGSDGRKVRNKLVDDKYYVDANGKKVKNDWYKFTRNINGNSVIIWYYLGEDGAKLCDTLTPDGYYVDQNGMYIPGNYDSPDSEKYVPKN